MLRKSIMQMILLTVSACSLCAFSDVTITEGDFTFQCYDSSSSATLTRYSGTASHVSVPSSVSYTATEYIYDSNGDVKYDDDGKPRTKTVTHTYDVTSVSYAFSNNTNVTDVTLPSSVKSLYGAFHSCSSLKSVNLDQVETIGYSTFWGTALVSVVIPSSVKSLGECAFADCPSLVSVTIPSSVTNIEGFAFQNCRALTSVTTPSSLRYLGIGAFVNCTSLKTAVVNGSDLELGNAIFARCTSLETAMLGSGIVSIEDGSYSMGWLADSYSGLFSDCTSLKSVDILTTRVRKLPNYMFYNSSVKTVRLAGGFTEIGKQAFWQCSDLETIEGPLIPTSIGHAAFYRCSRFQGSIDFSKCETLADYAFYQCGDMECDVNLLEATNLESSVFYGCSSLTRIQIPKVVNLKTSALYGCSSLESIVIPNGVTNIESGVFVNCSSLKSIELPNTLKYLGSTFSGCSSLKTAIIDGDMVHLGSEVFMGCQSLENVVLGPGVASLADGYTYYGAHGMFVGCSSLKTVEVDSTMIVSIPDWMFRESSVERVRFAGVIDQIGTYAFSKCRELVSLEGDVRPSCIKDGAFSECRKLTGSIDFSACTNLMSSAFYTCSSLEGEIVLPKLDEVSSSAFANCSSITKVTLPVAKKIMHSAFRDCSNMQELAVPTVTNIEGYAFYGCTALKDLYLPSCIKINDESAFADCQACNEVVLGKDLVAIGHYAFGVCTNASTFVFEGVPPSVGNYAFSGVKKGAIGTYLPEHKAAWDAVIGADGTWNGLVMAVNRPILSNGGCDVAAGSLTINWDSEDAPMPPGMTYEVRRGFSDDYAASEVLTNGCAQLYFVDTDFYVTGGVSRIWYWVKPEHSLFEPSEPLVTKNRFLLSVGYDAYQRANPIEQFYVDASSFKSACVREGGFLELSAYTRLLRNATTKDIVDALSYFAEVTKPGDIFVLYIATHGEDHNWYVDITGLNRKISSLSTYNGSYSALDLQLAVRRFDVGVAVINIVMACNASAMSGETSGRMWVDNWLDKSGFGQCLGNVAWIVSCNAGQYSYIANTATYTMFGQSFVHDGFMNGYADEELYGVEFDGVEYKGGNSDGVITLGELGRYAGAFAKGISDDCPSDVKLENAGLLDRIIIAKGIVPSSLNRPEPPVGVIATQGTFDFRTRVSWSASETATGYRVYRYPQGLPFAGKWVETTFGATSTDDFSTSFMDKLGVAMNQSIIGVKYQYYVKAINPVGVSEPSLLAEGWRGTTSFLSYLAGIIGAAPASITTEEYDAVENAAAANGSLTVGQCYAVGVNPEDPNDDLKISHFEIKDGKPVITLNHTEDGSGNSFMPRVKTLGKANLSDAEWREVPEEGDPSLRFFKVEVEMP